MPRRGGGAAGRATYIQWVHAEPLQLVQGTEQVLPTAMIRYVVVVLAR
jgi:hypothetical protein